MAHTDEFIERLKPHALEAAKKLGLHPGFLIAQAALETGWGRYVTKDKRTGESSNNLFNIKWHGSDRWDYVVADTKEYDRQSKRWVTVEAKFRKYPSLTESLLDYFAFLTQNPRYQKALKVRHDPEAFAQALQEAGYATDPDYAKKIISILHKHHLSQLG